MQITVTFGPGFHVEGVVLSVGSAGLRVAMADWEDAAEFQMRAGQWFLENREPVDIAWPKASAVEPESPSPANSYSRFAAPSAAWVN